jgi:hypothetical protein
METIVRDTIAFTSEDIGEGSQISVQISSEPFEVEPGCVAFVGAVDENPFGGFIQCFPNPSTGVFTIQSINGERLNRLEVFNAFGVRIVQIENMDGTEFNLDLHSNPPGLYFLKTVVDHKTTTQKLLLQ